MKFDQILEYDMPIGKFTVSVQISLYWKDGSLSNSIYYLVFDDDGYDVFDNADWEEVLEFVENNSQVFARKPVLRSW